ncbi:MAG: hypothetical protein K0Q78_2299 [Cellvibrio sp.]|nr:hypothetical protein [Cellvibrio sp.]
MANHILRDKVYHQNPLQSRTMPVIIFLWPTTTRFLYATLLLSLCTLTTLAQEPATTAPPATVNEISSNSQSSEAPLYPSHDINHSRHSDPFSRKRRSTGLATHFGKFARLLAALWLGDTSHNPTAKISGNCPREIKLIIR